jgi:hypothetical protein
MSRIVRLTASEMNLPFRKWTSEDDDRLAEMRDAGKTPVLIAKALKRTEASPRLENICAR